jgi:hypothetical protein
LIAFNKQTEKGPIFELMSRMQKRLPGYIIHFDGRDGHVPIVKGRRIYIPGSSFPEDTTAALGLLAWAYVFCLDKHMKPIQWRLLYWFPRYFALLALLTPWALLSVKMGAWSFIFLLPVIALFLKRVFRPYLMARAFAGMIAVHIWTDQGVPPDRREFIVDSLSGFGLFRHGDANEIVAMYEKMARVDSIFNQDPLIYESDAFLDLYEVVTEIDLDGDIEWEEA